MTPMTLTILILGTGIAVVVGGVLLFRLHAFLALTLGALVVALLTPSANVRRNQLDTERLQIVDGANDGEIGFVLPKDYKVPQDTVCYLFDGFPESNDPGEAEAQLIVRRSDTVILDDGRKQNRVYAEPIEGEAPSADSTGYVVTAAAFANAKSIAGHTIGKRVSDAFGSTCGKIGILIAMASIVGTCLLESGAADRIVRSALKVLGEAGAPVAFILSGFLLGIPVFFDTVFYLMIPLGKAMRVRTGRNYLLYVLAIITGGTMAHSLVPPTPGPLFVAEQLGVDLGVMILAGCVVGLFTAGYGFVHSIVANRIWDFPLRETPDMSLADLEKITQRDEKELPSLWLSLLPIVLPVIFIAGYTVLSRFSGLPDGLMRVAKTLGDKNIALTLSAAIALLTLIRQKKSNLRELGNSIQSSLASAGVIILITAAGGAFGRVLQQTGVAGLINELPELSNVMIVAVAFLITAAIRTAQGSATVAMITAVGILSGLVASLSFHPVYLALAIGCGSKPIGWMNDSGFWVMTRMSGMTEAEGLKYITPLTSAMGVVGLLVVMAGVTWLPMS